MGYSPPPDAPHPDVQDAVKLVAGFAPGPPVASLCGFKLPTFLFILALLLPAFKFPPFTIPSFNFSLSLNCDLSNPLNLTADVAWGGGRVANYDPDPGEVEFAQAA